MLQGITLCWARNGQDQLIDLFCIYFLLFLTVGKKTLLEERLKLLLLPPSHLCLLKREQTISHCKLMSEALFVTTTKSLPPLLLCSPSVPTYWEALERISWRREERKKKKERSESLISDLSRPLYNIHLFWAAFDTSFPPTLIRNQLWIASSCSFFSLKVHITILFLSRAQ